MSNIQFVRENFSDLLRKIFSERRITTSQAADLMGISQRTLHRIMDGKMRPEWEIISEWLKSLQLSGEQLRLLYLNYEVESIQSDSRSLPRFDSDPVYDLSDSIRSLQSDISDISTALAEVTKQVQERENVERHGNDPDPLSVQLQAVIAKMEKLEVTGDRLTAQVEVPTPDRMKVKLVPSTLVAQMEEYRSDSVIWYSLAGAFFGAVLGVYVNWATGGELTSAATVLIAIFLILMVIFIILIRRNERRLDLAKSQMLGVEITHLVRMQAHVRRGRAIWLHNLVDRVFGADEGDSVLTDPSDTIA